jgi:PPOX class probable F420-dependent enzyme
MARPDDVWLDFLAGTHVAVLAVARPGRGPLLAPIWYEYDPAVGFRFVTSAASAKSGRLAAAGRASVCIQHDDGHYKYVVAEGTVTVDGPDDAAAREVLRSIAIRYFGERDGNDWIARFNEPDAQIVTLRPERWRTEDLGDPRDGE